MKKFEEMTREELSCLRQDLAKQYEDYKAMNLSLDMTRGKPAPEQLDLTNDIYESLSKTGYKTASGVDTRNYSSPAGIEEMRKTFGDILGTDKDNVFLGNSSSLNMMFDNLMRAMVFGEPDSDCPWYEIKGRKWLCPAPGYDRHFRVTETLGFELITVPMTDEGPDMDVVEELVKDPLVLGMWIVPVYSNPDGIVCSEEVCRRIANMKTAAPDFRLYWDNAYVVHHLYRDSVGKVPDMLALCEEAGNPNRVYEFASTSKITFAGAGISCLACNKENMAQVKKISGVQTICSNKVNQLAHANLLPDMEAVDRQMRKQADLIRPKFDAALSVLNEDLKGAGFARWTDPLGGYFISLYVMPGTAAATVKLCKECGVALTNAGATYPYGIDPTDSNIRLAPTFPSAEDIGKATRILAICAKITAIDKLLED